MALLSNTYKLTKAQYDELLEEGEITVGGVTYEYDPNAVYLVEDNSPAIPYISSSDLDKFLHTNSSTGSLEWSIVNSANYYPTAFSWTNGTTAGPTGSLTGTGMSAVSFGAIPAASDSQSGIVTTGDQTFAGTKTFTSRIQLGSSSSSAAYIGYNSSNELIINTWGTEAARFSNSQIYIERDLKPYFANVNLGGGQNYWKNFYISGNIYYKPSSTQYTLTLPQQTGTLLVDADAIVTATASKIAKRDSSGDLNAVAFNLCSSGTSTPTAAIEYDTTNECIKFVF